MTRAVRQATVDDVWTIHDVARESWHAAYDDILGADRVDEVVADWYAIGDLESAIMGTNGRENAVFLVSEAPPAEEAAEPWTADDGSADDAANEPRFEADLNAYAHAVPWPEDTSVAFLARLYVRPDDWNEGIGTALLEELEARLMAEFDRLRLAVLAENEIGISFYESRGFHRVETRSSDLGPGLTEHVYEKRLSTGGE
ncbi:GNAT family N-acetyltransferase [Natrinema halophilum]|uniref:GNAT family N-acetyltransferase n=1 Tax=Natrinema halophilum TaxID=1699371 RepID=A0A7D5KD33_9EURY|nr:GNAT family N-acetyltransferase [Natrinema halophilum]QLG49076.1 GNAT family N-acetyltransferase [Natrinema halophilum]